MDIDPTTPDRAATPAGREPLTDEGMAGLVRDLAETWTMPPRGLRDVPWQARIATRPSGRQPRGRGWLGQLGGRIAAAGFLAVIALVVLSLVGVWLQAPSRPGGIVGSGSPSATSPSGTVATPLGTASGLTGTASPGVASPSAVTVSPSSGVTRIGAPAGQWMPAGFVGLRDGVAYAVAELGTGRLTTITGSPDGTDAVVALPGRGFACLCPARTAVIPSVAPGHEVRTLVIREYRGDGTVVGENTGFPALDIPLVTLDANVLGDASALNGDRPRIVTTLTLAPDGWTLFVGWAYRQPDSWHSGVWVVDMGRRLQSQTVELPVMPLAPGEVRDVEAPRVEVSPSGASVVIRARSYTDLGVSPYQHWSAAFSDGLVGALTAMPDGAGTLLDTSCSDPQVEGFATEDSYFAACTNMTLRADILVLRRVRLDGTPIGDTPIAQLAPHGLIGTGFAVDHHSGTLYSWSPFGRLAGRVDLATGTIVSVRSMEPVKGAAGSDWLGSLGRSVGRWLAPVALAKVDLSPSLVLSPAGDRLYGLDVGSDDPTSELVGSGGIDAIDAATLGLVAHWEPAADYWSIAISDDGSWLYAAGVAGVDAAGQESGLTQSSLTVHATADGTVRLRLPSLGTSRSYRLPGPVVP